MSCAFHVCDVYDACHDGHTCVRHHMPPPDKHREMEDVHNWVEVVQAVDSMLQAVVHRVQDKSLAVQSDILLVVEPHIQPVVVQLDNQELHLLVGTPEDLDVVVPMVHNHQADPDTEDNQPLI